MDAGLKQTINEINQIYAPEGFTIVGVFGSHARGDSTIQSDIDFLYRLSEKAINKYPGWDIFLLYERVKNDLELRTGKRVDLADENGLSKTGQRFILPAVEYV
ncbi:nucleotidyltransferase family protein [Turneriella parva]|uniref:DNA polymerase beta domain-containing protein region n=1 Tax=Turneriella parva (strain ATCC BAA-1111 / DSM 21527 / NCTC 11395 / H) TaxID=869212 RepID=I4B4A7_TURPD|nr:nucleotidyltransferase domain-containing protein [Turneriella parva]AFM12114.1 DNA polymerase beta domain-containing protein region [Turneriella parva DSM 21527]